MPEFWEHYPGSNLDSAQRLGILDFLKIIIEEKRKTGRTDV